MNDNGGLACREVVVDSLDTKLSADESHNAVIAACEDSVALVGTTAVFLNAAGMSEAEQCSDRAGEATGIPDLAVLQTEPAQQCSVVSFAVIAGTGRVPLRRRGRTHVHGTDGNDRLLPGGVRRPARRVGDTERPAVDAFGQHARLSGKPRTRHRTRRRSRSLHALRTVRLHAARASDQGTQLEHPRASASTTTEPSSFERKRRSRESTPWKCGTARSSATTRD